MLLRWWPQGGSNCQRQTIFLGAKLESNITEDCNLKTMRKNYALSNVQDLFPDTKGFLTHIMGTINYCQAVPVLDSLSANPPSVLLATWHHYN